MIQSEQPSTQEDPAVGRSYALSRRYIKTGIVSVLISMLPATVVYQHKIIIDEQASLLRQAAAVKLNISASDIPGFFARIDFCLVAVVLVACALFLGLGMILYGRKTWSDTRKGLRRVNYLNAAMWWVMPIAMIVTQLSSALLVVLMMNLPAIPARQQTHEFNEQLRTRIAEKQTAPAMQPDSTSPQ